MRRDDFDERVLAVVEAIPPGRVMSYGDIASAVAQRNGLTAGTIESGDTVPFVQQSNETDWELLWRLADETGCEVYVSAREL